MLKNMEQLYNKGEFIFENIFFYVTKILDIKIEN